MNTPSLNRRAEALLLNNNDDYGVQQKPCQTLVALCLRDPQDRYKETPKLTVPEKVGSYCMKDGIEEEESNYIDNDCLMRVLSVPLLQVQADGKHQNFDFDLLDEYQSMADGGWRPCDSSAYKNTGLFDILIWIQRHRETVSSRTRPVDYDFVGKNGCLSRIMDAVHEWENGWCIAATKFRGSIYLFKTVTEERRRQDAGRSEYVNKTSFGGFRFEKHISELADRHGDEDNQSHGEHYIVLSAEFGPVEHAYKLLYASEMDCVTSRDKVQTPEPHDFLEIKTVASAEQQHLWDKRLNRMFRWWTQTYLSGVSAVVVGNRDKDFHVREIEVIRTEDMPLKCQYNWSSRESLLFLHRFLQFVWETVVEDDPGVMYEFSFTPPDTGIFVTKTKPQPEWNVLPDWYINSF